MPSRLSPEVGEALCRWRKARLDMLLREYQVRPLKNRGGFVNIATLSR